MKQPDARPVSPPSYAESISSATNSTLSLSHRYPPLYYTPYFPEQKIADNNNVPPAIINSYESLDDQLERYKDYAARAILAIGAASIFAGIFALYAIFAGFTLNGVVMRTVIDTDEKHTNLTTLFVTIGTMVALYQTDSMKNMMNATVAKMDGLWNWDNMSHTTHEFLTFNVAFTLSVLVGLFAQGLVFAAISAHDQQARNKMKIN